MRTNNNLHKINCGLLLIMSILLFSSCFEKYHDFNLPEHEPRLVISSFFNANEPLQVNVSQSQSRVSNQSFLPVISASIQLYEDDVWVEKLVGSKNKSHIIVHDTVFKWYYYSEKTLPQPGRRYRIEVSVPGFETVVAESTVPEPTKISIIDTTIVYQDYNYHLYVDVQMDNPEQKQWFLISGASLIPVFESVGTGFPEIIGYNKSYFKFQIKDPIIGTLRIGDTNNFPLFTNQLLNGSYYRFTIDIPYAGTMHSNNASIDLVTLSEEAYAYLKSATDFNNNEPLYSEPVKVYTNVVGGLGVFAGICISSDTIKNISYPNTIYK